MMMILLIPIYCQALRWKLSLSPTRCIQFIQDCLLLFIYQIFFQISGFIMNLIFVYALVASWLFSVLIRYVQYTVFAISGYKKRLVAYPLHEDAINPGFLSAAGESWQLVRSAVSSLIYSMHNVISDLVLMSVSPSQSILPSNMI